MASRSQQQIAAGRVTKKARRIHRGQHRGWNNVEQMLRSTDGFGITSRLRSEGWPRLLSFPALHAALPPPPTFQKIPR